MAAMAALFSPPSLSFPSSSCKPTFYCSAKPRHTRKQPLQKTRVNKTEIVSPEKGKEEANSVISPGAEKKDKQKRGYLRDYDLKDESVSDTIGNAEAPYLNSVVKVYCTTIQPNYSLPWQKRMQCAVSGSAFMIGDGKLLTNAHVVEYSTQVKVKKRGDDTKYVAKVLAVGLECDIAILSVENKKFWEGSKPITLGCLPSLQDSVMVVGYPTGGKSISVTKGIVSRIEVTSYGHATTDLLGIQIDAAVNPGNSGGPVFNERGECIGIAFQVYQDGDTENIGYAIPSSVVSHFLHDYKRNGRYTGFPCIGVLLQKLENKALCECLKVPDGEGVLVRAVAPTAPCYDVLKKGDVIVSFDGVRIGNEGTIPFQSTELIGIRYLISRKYIGDTAELGIIRAGHHMKINTELGAPKYLVSQQRVVKPSYLIVCGLVFTPLSESFIEDEGEDSLGRRLLAKARCSLARFEGEQIVMLSQVLPNDANIGYEDMRNLQVTKLNGKTIKNMRHLAHLVDSCREKYFVFEFEDSFLAVIEKGEAASASQELLKSNGIHAGRSEDLCGSYADREEDNNFLEPAGVGDVPVTNDELESEGLFWA